VTITERFLPRVEKYPFRSPTKIAIASPEIIARTIECDKAIFAITAPTRPSRAPTVRSTCPAITTIKTPSEMIARTANCLPTLSKLPDVKNMGLATDKPVMKIARMRNIPYEVQNSRGLKFLFDANVITDDFNRKILDE
jgi:hypothetical protein